MSKDRGQNVCRRHCMIVHAHYPMGETRVERQAMALLEQGIEVDILCLREPTELAAETVNGAQVYRLSVSRRRGTGLIAQLREYLLFFALAFVRLTGLHLQRHYDVVQVHNLPDFLVFAALVPKLMGARIVLDLHDLMPEFYAERFEQPMNSLMVRLIRWQERLSCCFADHVITVTELWRKALIARGLPPHKVSVVMNVADDRIFHRDVEADSRKESNGFRIVYHGAMEQRHGLDLVVKALSEIHAVAPDIHLTLHGGGKAARQALVILADELGIRDCVEFSTHYVPTAELPQLLKTAHLAIVPYRNGVFAGGILPTKMMEYAALGIPVIASRTTAIATYFGDTMVEFFNPDDAQDLSQHILDLYQDRARLSELAHNITTFNQRYNWSAQKQEYVALIQQLSSGGRVPVLACKG